MNAQPDWTKLGRELRQAALDAYITLPHIEKAYGFLLANPEAFDFEEWPAGMPEEPNMALIAAYYNVGAQL